MSVESDNNKGLLVTLNSVHYSHMLHILVMRYENIDCILYSELQEFVDKEKKLRYVVTFIKLRADD